MSSYLNTSLFQHDSFISFLLIISIKDFFSDSEIAKCNSYVHLPGDIENQVELEEKTRLINQVLELQNTLEGK